MKRFITILSAIAILLISTIALLSFIALSRAEIERRRDQTNAARAARWEKKNEVPVEQEKKIES